MRENKDSSAYFLKLFAFRHLLLFISCVCISPDSHFHPNVPASSIKKGLLSILGIFLFHFFLFRFLTFVLFLFHLTAIGHVIAQTGQPPVTIVSCAV